MLRYINATADIGSHIGASATQVGLLQVFDLIEAAMISAQIPVSRCHSKCPVCRSPSSEFRLFESGMGGDFLTYVGKTTGSLYRVDVGITGYMGISLADVLAPAIEREGGSQHLWGGKQLQCKFCGKTFSWRTAHIDGEELVTAFLL